MTVKPGTGNMRLLIRNLRTQTQVPNGELARLNAIEKAARELIDSEYQRTFGPPLYDVANIGKLKRALKRKPCK
jgi:hypothetical protein